MADFDDTPNPVFRRGRQPVVVLEDLQPGHTNGATGVLDAPPDAVTILGADPVDAELSDDDEVGDPSDAPSDVARCADVLVHHIFETGQASRVELRKLCKTKGFDTALFNRALKFLTTNVKLFREALTDEGEKVFQLREKFQTQPDIVSLINIARNKVRPKADEYSDFYTVSGHFRLILPCYGSQPSRHETGKLRFFKGPDGEVVLLDIYFARMWQTACELDGTSAPVRKARFAAKWAYQTMDRSLVEYIDKPVPPRRRGEGGQGLTDVEILPAGTLIPFEVRVPGSHVPVVAVRDALDQAGKYVGFSPSCAHQGLGRFQLRPDDAFTALLRETDAEIAAIKQNAALRRNAAAEA